jgi:hypothetical protein
MNRTRWHFLFGTLAGTLTGLILWREEFPDSPSGWLFIPFTAAALGFVAAYFQEDFWPNWFRAWWS